jgi:hypothetical protein
VAVATNTLLRTMLPESGPLRPHGLAISVFFRTELPVADPVGVMRNSMPAGAGGRRVVPDRVARGQDVHADVRDEARRQDVVLDDCIDRAEEEDADAVAVEDVVLHHVVAGRTPQHDAAGAVVPELVRLEGASGAISGTVDALVVVRERVVLDLHVRGRVRSSTITAPHRSLVTPAATKKRLDRVTINPAVLAVRIGNTSRDAR